jgi:hypothetical protein
VLYGSGAGLRAWGSQLWHQNSPGILGTATPWDIFGTALAAGDANGDRRADLAVGAPREDYDQGAGPPTPFDAGHGPRHLWVARFCALLVATGLGGYHHVREGGWIIPGLLLLKLAWGNLRQGSSELSHWLGYLDLVDLESFMLLTERVGTCYDPTVIN